MKKIFFPFDDQPKQFSFQFSEPIRFPFYVNDLVYYWEIHENGIVLYLHNEKISSETPTLKDIVLEDTGIVLYLVNETTGTSKHIIVEFAKIGKGIHTLGLLDPLTLGVIDPFTLGDISNCFANWMTMAQSIAQTQGNTIIDPENVGMRLKHPSILPYQKNVFTGNLEGSIGITGLYNQGFTTLGELDPYALNHIDAMLTTFRKFDNIPASLVKEIRIVHKNMINNHIISPHFDIGVDACGVGKEMVACTCPLHGIIFSSNITELKFIMRSDSKAEYFADTVLQPQTHFIGLKNDIVPLNIIVDEISE